MSGLALVKGKITINILKIKALSGSGIFVYKDGISYDLAFDIQDNSAFLAFLDLETLLEDFI
ncbi:hypothetical protein CR532_05330 (plasmid) [Candidatus Borreliella tachyglossi]|uniref:Uncharacterized protein n=1 Tax=Candidatus Borreliella tachyglossi TaxID=1964448 RepID=A0A2S1LYS7_9SPIR|nr:hypothetical protein [Candidatus Borreliella tachyglossi]AWG43420.1 hypothetical protein CR532_05330 [Candidatus Borreliella tachyglossi]